MQRTLALSLKEGINHLLIKNYNRDGSPDLFALKPQPDAQWYTLKVPIRASGEHCTLILKGVDPPTPHTPVDLPNIWIKIGASQKEKTK